MEQRITSLHEDVHKTINKTTVSLKQQIHAQSELIDKKFKAFNQKINVRIEIVDQKIKPIEQSIDFISGEFEQHKDLKDVKAKKKNLEKENTLLHAHIKVIQEQVEMEKQKRNEILEQYTRTTWMLNVVGIPNITN